MWVLPEMDIFTSNPVIKRYRSCPPGNIPELCNLDYCLNKDLHKAVGCHVRYTHSYHKLDPKTFSIATPKKGTSAYLQIFDTIGGVASSIEKIIHVIYDLFD